MASNLINRVQLPNKCSECGNRMFRAQYTMPGDKKVRSVDYCPHCNLELENRLLHQVDKEQSLNRWIKRLKIVALIGIIAAAAAFIVSQFL